MPTTAWEKAVMTQVRYISHHYWIQTSPSTKPIFQRVNSMNMCPASPIFSPQTTKPIQIFRTSPTWTQSKFLYLPSPFGGRPEISTSSCEKSVIKTVLNHLTKKGSPSLGEGIMSESFLSDVDLPIMWNQYRLWTVPTPYNYDWIWIDYIGLGFLVWVICNVWIVDFFIRLIVCGSFVSFVKYMPAIFLGGLLSSKCDDCGGGVLRTLSQICSVSFAQLDFTLARDL